MPEIDDLPLETLPPSAEKQPFSYPSIGNGVTIWAVNQEEADAIAARHPLNS